VLDHRRVQLAGLTLVALVLGLWTLQVSSMVAHTGLFAAVGYDFGMYLAQVAALRSGDLTGLYRLDVLDGYHRALAVYTIPGVALPSAPVPYPPLFAWLLQPFALLPPSVAFLLWTALNTLALGVLAWRIGPLVPGPARRWLAVLLLVFPGVLPALILGQPMLLLACVTAEFYVSLRAGRELRAGLWLACLFLKPQYGILAGLLLLWKRRWAGVAGAMVGGLVVLIGSALVGVPALLAYPSSLADTAAFRNSLTNPIDMINWRSLSLVAQTVMPTLIGDQVALLITLALGGVTVGVCVLVWRGPWNPRERIWPLRMSALWMATLLANYHSHIYGLALLPLPLAATLATPGLSRRTVLILLGGLALPAVLQPALLFVPALRHVPSWLLTLSLAAGLTSLALEIWLRDWSGAMHGARESALPRLRRVLHVN